MIEEHFDGTKFKRKSSFALLNKWCEQHLTRLSLGFSLLAGASAFSLRFYCSAANFTVETTKNVSSYLQKMLTQPTDIYMVMIFSTIIAPILLSGCVTRATEAKLWLVVQSQITGPFVASIMFTPERLHNKPLIELYVELAM